MKLKCYSIFSFPISIYIKFFQKHPKVKLFTNKSKVECDIFYINIPHPTKNLASDMPNTTTQHPIS